MGKWTHSISNVDEEFTHIIFLYLIYLCYKEGGMFIIYFSNTFNITYKDMTQDTKDIYANTLPPEIYIYKQIKKKNWRILKKSYSCLKWKCNIRFRKLDVIFLIENYIILSTLLGLLGIYLILKPYSTSWLLDLCNILFYSVFFILVSNNL